VSSISSEVESWRRQRIRQYALTFVRKTQREGKRGRGDDGEAMGRFLWLAVRWRSHTSSPKLAVVMVQSFFAAVETVERERNGERDEGRGVDSVFTFVHALATWRHRQSVNATRQRRSELSRHDSVAV
jgi:hypothetical protein